VLHLTMAKSFVAVSGEEEAIPLPVKVIVKAKSAFPVDAGLSPCAVYRHVGRKKRAIGRVSTILLSERLGEIHLITYIMVNYNDVFH